ncbi:MAG: hypothetical protein AMK74_02615 [Nitrospira bacterium SM23_35]|nr:MAG: hypothetical protein AMK74_02615 [Nitrospira bacterium SM23_35]
MKNPAAELRGMRSLSDSTSSSEREKHILSVLREIRDDAAFKKRWELLWSWSHLKNQHNRSMFFKVQSFLRNKVAQGKRKQCDNINSLM